MAKKNEFLKKSEILGYLENEKKKYFLGHTYVSLDGDKIHFVNGNVVVSEISLFTNLSSKDEVKYMLPSGISPSAKGLDVEEYWNPQFGVSHKYYPTKRNFDAWLGAISKALNK